MVHCCCACAEPYLHSLVNKVAQLYSPKPFGRKDSSRARSSPFWKRRHFGDRLEVERWARELGHW